MKKELAIVKKVITHDRKISLIKSLFISQKAPHWKFCGYQQIFNYICKHVSIIKELLRVYLFISHISISVGHFDVVLIDGVWTWELGI